MYWAMPTYVIVALGAVCTASESFARTTHQTKPSSPRRDTGIYSLHCHHKRLDRVSFARFPCVPPSSCVVCRLMVGVPNGTTDGRMLDHTGLVFSCPLSASGSGSCLPTEGDLYDTGDNMPAGEIGVQQDKSGQQMGFSMQSGGQLLVCGVCLYVLCTVMWCGVLV